MRTKSKPPAATAAAGQGTRPEPWRRALLVSLPALTFLLCCSPLADFDVWWHMRTGQLILDMGTVPRVDLFTYTGADRPWIDVHWLYQVGVALLYKAGGAWFAHDACAFLARADMPERMVAYNISQAAVCIAHGAPVHKQFMDPRLEVNTSDTFERYLAGIQRLWRNDATWEQTLGIDHGRPDEIPAILIERGALGRAADILSHDARWRCVFADALATVFVTTQFANQHQLPAASVR